MASWNNYVRDVNIEEIVILKAIQIASIEVGNLEFSRKASRWVKGPPLHQEVDKHLMEFTATLDHFQEEECFSRSQIDNLIEMYFT